MSSRLAPLRPSATLVREVALTLGAAAGLFCIVATVAALGFGLKPLVFRSGSMGPEIPTGALALAQTVPAAQLEAGDVVSVVDDDGTRVTHRIVGIDRHDGAATLTLKGDANTVTDAQNYTVASADRVFFHVDGLGYAVAWLSSPVAVFAGGLVVGALVMFAVRPGVRRVSTGAVAVLLLSATAAVSSPGSPYDTLAAFTDRATAAGGSLSTRSVAAAPASCRTQGLVPSIYVSWTKTDLAYAYEVTVDGLSEQAFSQTVDNDDSVGSTQTVHITAELLSSLLGSDITVRVTTYLRDAPAWTASTTVPAHVNLLGLGMRCR